MLELYVIYFSMRFTYLIDNGVRISENMLYYIILCLQRGGQICVDYAANQIVPALVGIFFLHSVESLWTSITSWASMDYIEWSGQTACSCFPAMFHA